MATRHDVRVLKTRQRLQRALMEVLKDRKIEDISITQVCSAAGLNRNTFYAHYSDVYQLLDEVKSSYLEYFLNEISEYRKTSTGTQKTVTYFLKLVDASRDFFCILFTDNSGPVFLRSLVQLCLEDAISEVRPELESLSAVDYSAFVIGGVSNMIHEWFRKEDRESAEKEGAKISYFIHRTLR